MTESQQPTDGPTAGEPADRSGEVSVHPDGQPDQIVIVGPDGQPIGTIPAAMLSQATDDEDAEKHITELVEQPAKVMRIGGMIKNLLEEVKSAPLDEASRVRLKEIHQRSIKELETGLAPELVDELERLTLPFTEDGTPSEGELRIAQAQLVGWLEGLFHGIQTAIYAQQMAARAQFEQIRKQLPGGGSGQPGQPGQPMPHPGMPGGVPSPSSPSSGAESGNGMYL